MDTVQMFSLYLKYLKLNDSIESLELLALVFAFQLVIVPKSTMHDVYNGRYFEFYIKVYYDAFVGGAVTVRYFTLKTYLWLTK